MSYNLHDLICNHSKSHKGQLKLVLNWLEPDKTNNRSYKKNYYTLAIIPFCEEILPWLKLITCHES